MNLEHYVTGMLPNDPGCQLVAISPTYIFYEFGVILYDVVAVHSERLNHTGDFETTSFPYYV